MPQSLQTLAVVLVGGFLGRRTGMLTVAAYLLAGVLGLPVFADGEAGPGHLAGASGGYLVGFVFGAGVAGIWPERAARGGFGAAFALAMAAHVVILFFGWARLAASAGGGQAYASGVAPFLLGGLAKAVVAAAVLAALGGQGARTAPDPEEA